MPSLEQILSGRSVDNPAKPKIAMDVEVVRLRDAFAVYQRPSSFRPGDLVRQKEGIRIGSQSPSPNNAFVVMATRPEAEPHWNPADMATYGIRFDLFVGFYDEDGDFIFHWSDSRRYELLP